MKPTKGCSSGHVANIKWIDSYLAKQRAALKLLSRPSIVLAIAMLINALRKDGRIFVIGNGGSAANASHFATDLGKGASDVTEETIGRRFQVTSLTDNVPWITALGNDKSYDDVFSEQLRGLADPGDLLIGISVSGTSGNLVKAFEVAEELEMKTIALTRARIPVKSGRHIGGMADLWIKVDDDHYGVVEDAEMVVLHMLAYFFMENYEAKGE